MWMICFGGYGLHVVNALSGWDYDHTAHHHQRNEDWNGTCKDGKRQSPIDIIPKYTSNVAVSLRLILNGYDKQLGAQVANNGHTVELTFRDGPDKDIWVKDGDIIQTKYEFKQAHFHWGDNDQHGSEHKIDGKAFPMEMHLVHWNLDVGKNLTEAVQKDTRTALEVLGVHFKIGKTNGKFNDLFEAMKKVKKHGNTSNIINGIRLNDLLPSNIDSFYRYKGSLTTPGCNEVVMWTVFKEQIEIDEEQMQIMREITYDHNGKEEFMYNNYREVQLENGRNIIDNSLPGVIIKTEDSSSGQLSCLMPFNANSQWMLLINFVVFMYLKI